MTVVADTKTMPPAQPAGPLKHLWLTAVTDIMESLRARWFVVYSAVFGGLIVLLYVMGLTESRIMGFSGLSRLLVTYIQLSMAILPVFILVTTVRSVAGDREDGVLEYLLSLPVGLGAWFFGRVIGRFVVVFLPVLLAMLAAVAWGALAQDTLGFRTTTSPFEIKFCIPPAASNIFLVNALTE